MAKKKSSTKKAADPHGRTDLFFDELLDGMPLKDPQRPIIHALGYLALQLDELSIGQQLQIDELAAEIRDLKSEEE